ncbi:DUF2203 domain-containing protein [Bailinhaonella thermotolerans]|uniref:DUF2203 family protein n=1 Tax=Bailinhaonella thermotolerans TaxID=1070861 RepID=A0A3A4AVY9_9ACTN|nr:DUF2203 domain-containing protein [Bailinhaonella thermotolerans]RJL34390.1 DUF2203 family protein [Bailinhaonella thermotolerans]
MDSERTFTVDEARSLLPAVRARVAELVTIRADLAQLVYDLQQAGTSPLGGVAEAKAAEARLDDIVTWFADEGIEVKGISPVLVDFPSTLAGQSVRLCWVEGEPDLAWYHPTVLGFPGRRPLPDGL